MSPPYRVLIVEDDADSVALMRQALHGLPLEFQHAASGAAAASLLAREVPDLVFLDIELPDMHGWELLDRYKADQRLAGVPVLVLTAHGDPVHRLIGMLQPIVAYLRKPVPSNELRQQVCSLLQL